MKQAKPSPDECRKFLEFMQGLERICHGDSTPDGESVAHWLYKQWFAIGPIWQRVFFAGQMAIENACDPNADTLEWKPELKMQAETHSAMRQILKEITETTCSFEITQPLEQPTDDGPWLPVGLMSRIYAVLETT